MYKIQRATRLYLKIVSDKFCATTQGVKKEGKHLIFMIIRCYKSQFTVGLCTQLYLDNCAERIR